MIQTRRSAIWRSTTIAAAGGLIAVAGAAAALPASASGDGDDSRSVRTFRGPLQDLQPTTTEPLEGARAKVSMIRYEKRSVFILRVRGIDLSAVGHDYGAHLHSGPCVAGDPLAAGPHYNNSKTVPPTVNDRTEVWLDFTVNDLGRGHARASVPFVPKPGNHSVVIHLEGTDPMGMAGARLACLPVEW
jgi:Cu/Zn superoxide dismutase